ncbi:MAG: hypothetical protein WHU10_07455 [Fimbriimonadales bacterium]
MKVSIIGGAGRVGADAAYALQLGGLVRDIAIVDMNRDLADGEALDLRHGAALTDGTRILSGGYEVVDGSDCVVITAGLRRKPDESRLELINRNVGLFKSILNSLKECELKPDTTILVVSNPVDILTYLAVKSDILPPNQVFGLGTVLDTCRFRSLLGAHFNVGAQHVHALILGEHGDSMVPIWSSATISGVPLSSIPGFSQDQAHEIFEQTKKAGAEVIRLKGGAGRAVGVSIMAVVHALFLDRGTILPISTYQHGTLGIEDVCLSMPTKIGRRGVIRVLEPVTNFIEQEGLQMSAESLKKVIQQVGV